MGNPNPYRPGAGFAPPFLAGRTDEVGEYESLLNQPMVMKNLVITGLRGVGKTVLLEHLRPISESAGWLWVSSELSEAALANEECLAYKIITDLATLVSGIELTGEASRTMGFVGTPVPRAIDFAHLWSLYRKTPGLPADRLKMVVELVWQCLERKGCVGVALGYDEAQNLRDRVGDSDFPLSMLLGVFQAVQAAGVKIRLILSGLPPLFPNLVACRTYSERMFQVLGLGNLATDAARNAIEIPQEEADIQFDEMTVQQIMRYSGGYPYFIQYLAYEAYEHFVRQRTLVMDAPIDIRSLLRRLDRDFYSGRWAQASDSQRELLRTISSIENCENGFTVKSILEALKKAGTKESPSNLSQKLSKLIHQSLVYKVSRGKYEFALPMFGEFIQRQIEDDQIQ